MTILAICQAAAPILSVPTPSSIVGNPDPTCALMLSVANRGGRALAARYGWQALRKIHSFTYAVSSPLAVPDDFGRFVADTMWNKTRRQFVRGPVDAVEWNEISNTTSSQLEPVFRYFGSTFGIEPRPIGDTITYEYIDENWVFINGVNGGSYGTAFTADTHISRLPEELHVLDLIWRYRAEKGLDFDTQRLDFERALVDAIQQDGGKGTINLGGTRRGSARPGRLIIPDSI